MWSIENMTVDLSDLVEGWHPVGHDPVGVIVGRRSDRSEDLASESASCGCARSRPSCMFRSPCQRAVAGKGELATGRAPRTLVHHAADRLRILGKRKPIEHHLDHGFLAAGIIASFVQRSRSETLNGLLSGCRGAPEVKRASGDKRLTHEGSGGVDGSSLLHSQPGRRCRGQPGAANGQPKEDDEDDRQNNQKDGSRGFTTRRPSSSSSSPGCRRHSGRIEHRNASAKALRVGAKCA
jgi:hypothetical protein